MGANDGEDRLQNVCRIRRLGDKLLKLVSCRSSLESGAETILFPQTSLEEEPWGQEVRAGALTLCALSVIESTDVLPLK